MTYRKGNLLSLALGVATLTGLHASADAQTQLFVSNNGKDTWAGTLSSPNSKRTNGPKKTLEGARNEIRKLRLAGQLDPAGAVVVVKNGTYTLKNGFVMDWRDVAPNGAPVVFKAQEQGKVVLDGGRVLTSWRTVPKNIRETYLSPEVQLKVRQCSLKALRIAKTKVARRGTGADTGETMPEIIYDNRRMQLSSYPNTGWLTVPSGQIPTPSSFRTNQNRPSNWHFDRADVNVYGYLGQDWADVMQPATVDNSGNVTLADPSKYGVKIGQRYKLVNVLEELDTPGEYYINQSKGTIYFYPIDANPGRKATITFLEEPLISAFQTSNIRFEGFTLQNGRGVGVNIEGSQNCSARGMTIRNMGTSGAIVKWSTNSGIDSCDISGTGERVITLHGGDRATLTSSNNYATNNYVTRWGEVVQVSTGIVVYGVGNYVGNNRLTNAAFQAIWINGNNHLVENNEVSDVLKQTNDAAAIYIGRNPTFRGNVVRNNLIQDVKSTVINPQTGQPKGDAAAMYFDDMASGVTFEGNIIKRCSRGMVIGGGRDNTIQNNVFEGNDIDIQADARGITAPTDLFAEWGIPAMLAEVPYTQAPYSSSYPHLANLMSDEPKAPKYNVVARNVQVGSPQPYWWRDNTNTLVNQDGGKAFNITANYVGLNPGFVNSVVNDYRPMPGSNAEGIGFEGIDGSTIGLQVNEFRIGVNPLGSMSRMP